MRYMLLIYAGEDAPAGDSEEAKADYPKWFQFTEDLKAAGAFLAGEPLMGAETAVDRKSVV